MTEIWYYRRYMSLVSTTLCTLTFPLMVALYHLLGFALPPFA